MKSILYSFAIIFCFSAAVIAQPPGRPVVAPEVALDGMGGFLNYYKNHLFLSQDFSAYDVNRHMISKGEFLKAVSTGDYLPLQLTAEKNKLSYMLYELKEHTVFDITYILQQTGIRFYRCYQMEGKSFPDFHYVDLNGNIYNPQNTRGKILILQAFEVSYKTCITEIPKLNKLTRQYKNNKDIVFVGVSWDSKKELKALKKREGFKYAIVPVDVYYLEKDLGAMYYPVYWVINKKGIVVKMTYDVNEMIAALHKEAAQ